MGHVFSLILNREITDDEAATLREAGCQEAVLGTDQLPTDAEVTVTKLDFDDTVSPSLAEAIENALAAVKTVEDLSVPGLTVPAVKKDDEIEGEVVGTSDVSATTEAAGATEGAEVPAGR